MINDIRRLLILPALALAASLVACATPAAEPPGTPLSHVEAASSADEAIDTAVVTADRAITAAETAVAVGNLAIDTAQALRVISPVQAAFARNALDTARNYIALARSAFEAGERVQAAELLKRAAGFIAAARASTSAPPPAPPRVAGGAKELPTAVG